MLLHRLHLLDFISFIHHSKSNIAQSVHLFYFIAVFVISVVILILTVGFGGLHIICAHALYFFAIIVVLPVIHAHTVGIREKYFFVRFTNALRSILVALLTYIVLVSVNLLAFRRIVDTLLLLRGISRVMDVLSLEVLHHGLFDLLALISLLFKGCRILFDHLRSILSTLIHMLPVNNKIPLNMVRRGHGVALVLFVYLNFLFSFAILPLVFFAFKLKSFLIVTIVCDFD